MSYRQHAALALAAILTGAGASLLAEPVSNDGPASQGGALAPQDNPTRVLEASLLTDIESLIDRLADRRVIFVGEHHDRYEDHLNQLAVIQGLHARGKSLAIGLEMFQQPYQADIDAYLAGEIDEPDFLRRTQYFDRWRFDYRLYRPILHFARERGIPVIALNLESELTRKVGDSGIGGLSEEERARIPAEIDRENLAYRARIEAIFKHHPTEQQANFEHFLDVQLLWDEGMAERAARYLAEHPERTLVVISGGGHVEYGQGIPKRLMRRQPVPMAILLNGNQRTPDPAAADFFLYPQSAELPPSGKLGVMLNSDMTGEGLLVDGLADDSGAKAAGLRAGDRILRVDDQPIRSYADIRIALMDARPGRTVPVEVARNRLIGAEERLTLEVELR
ncbi:ChaN family lipoprotein [Thiocystis violacea]|uniref:ChaN family lipoprotein n=1 Tax=Thiocystis violacea TaxID=13725 RepID=UPI001907B599|nr:ChaN family lipoprotein [Thiocystis violacea]MBK1718300.1 iron-regulated protein [Thiocystis violacea]